MVESTEKPTLGYWATRGLGAQVTYLLAYAKVDYDFKVYTASVGEDGSWQRGTWPDDKFNLGIVFPNLPYFIDGDVKIAETMPLMRYVCNKWKPELVGTSDKEKAEMDMLACVVNELKVNGVMYPCYSHGDKAKIETDCKKRLEPIVKWLGEKKFLMGDNLCYVDFVLFECVNACEWVTESRVFTDYPTLKPYSERMNAIPEIKDALAAMDAKPFNNPFAKINNK